MAGAEPIVAGVAGRYATALFELALEAKALDQIEADLDAFQAMLDDSEDLRRLVRSPVFSAEDQERALSALLKKIDMGTLTANFLGLIARNRRLFAVGDMIRAFRALAAQHRGEVSAEVASAVKLSSSQLTALRTALKASIGQDVQITTRVDPSLLGGLVVKVGSRMIDSSLRTKLNNLRVAMREVG